MSMRRFAHAILKSGKRRPLVLGMIHVPALPGTSAYSPSKAILEQVRKETEIYAAAGVDGLLLENMNDMPYLRSAQIGPEVVACMTTACSEAVRSLGSDRSKVLMGVQILAGGNEQAMAVAKATDEGWMDGCAGSLLRYRKQIDAEGVSILVDIKKKHSAHAVTADVSLAETAKAAEFFGADGVVITGEATGKAAAVEDLEVKNGLSLPVVIGSGITLKNFEVYAASGADAFIIGSYFKIGGLWRNQLDDNKVKQFISAIRAFSSGE